MQGLPSFDDPNLIVGAESFSDAGVFRLRDDLLIVQSLDFFPPLVNDPYLFGQIAAANALSDVFAMGARPVTALNIVGFPDEELDLSILADILRGGGDQVKEAGAVVAGGHTVRDVEVKYGLSVTGVVEPSRLLTNSKAQPGDLLVLTKSLGTGFITTAHKAGRCAEDVMRGACDSMKQLNAIGCQAAQAHDAHAATDITGFGLAGHAGEMADASNVTLVLEVERLPILPGALAILNKNKTRASASNREFAEPRITWEGSPNATLVEFLFDPQTSGGLLLSLPESRAAACVEFARQAGAESACVVGRVEQRGATPLIIRP